MEIRSSFLIESALLTHGLISVSNDKMAELWPRELDNIVWVDKGKLTIGGMDLFLPFRSRAEELCRIDCTFLEEAMAKGVSGALTASGTMAVAEKMSVPLAVTCGMGGIDYIDGYYICPDLPALRDIPVGLIASSPKDMMDIPASIQWLRQAGVRVLGAQEPFCTGYIFNREAVPLQGTVAADLPREMKKLLILNPIPKDRRLQDAALLEKGVVAGKAAMKAGKYFHPAVNGFFDAASSGHSSVIQLEAIIANARLAETLSKHV